MYNINIVISWRLVVLMIVSLAPYQSRGLALTNLITSIDYGSERQLTLNMTSSKEITLRVAYNKDLVPAKGADFIRINFETSTISPQFNILSLKDQSITIDRSQLEIHNYIVDYKVRLHANYIGHAVFHPASVEFLEVNTQRVSKWKLPSDVNKLHVTIVQFEGIWGKIFLTSVIVLMIISYINLGAQLDEKNMLEIVKKPKILILGSLIGFLIMPLISWFVGVLFLKDQPLYRIGSFIFAACPAASASTLWTVMLNSDKELSVGLQVVSTVSAIFTMPFLLYLMDKSLYHDQESYATRVPYSRLISTLLGLLIALIIGWLLVGKNERLQKISRRIFRPLLFSVLIFIIVFSSILYWHIYQMFDWNISLASVIITMTTYLFTGLLGYCINCDMSRAVAISIGGAYKNSGIAFAVLLVSFHTPDTYIAYVPVLTQIVMTSITLYLTYSIVSLCNCLRRRGEPEVIQATTNSGRTPSKNNKTRTGIQDRNDEYIALNVDDPALPDENGQKETPSSSQQRTMIGVKIVKSDNNGQGSENP